MGWMTKVGSISGSNLTTAPARWVEEFHLSTGDLDLPSTQDGGVPVQS